MGHQEFPGSFARTHHALCDDFGMSQQTYDLVVMFKDKVRIR
jgi:hypothetical protein